MPRRSRRRRRGGKPAKDNSERWLITYADLLTLLLVFFVVMFAMSSINETRFHAFAASMQAALHKSDQIPLNHLGTSSLVLSGAQNTGTKSPTTPPTPAHAADVANASSNSKKTQSDSRQLTSLYQLIHQYIRQHHLEKKVSITNEPRGVQITMRDIALFGVGKAVLKAPAKKLIDGFVPFFKSVPNAIVVEGYTDNQPISTSVYPSNWELSGSRAMRVVRFLADKGLKPDRLSGIGYGQYHNIAPNDTPANRQKNRRVNIVVLRRNLQPGTAAAQP